MSSLEEIRNIKHTWRDFSRASSAHLQALIPLPKHQDLPHSPAISIKLPISPLDHLPDITSIFPSHASLPPTPYLDQIII